MHMCVGMCIWGGVHVCGVYLCGGMQTCICVIASQHRGR